MLQACVLIAAMAACACSFDPSGPAGSPAFGDGGISADAAGDVDAATPDASATPGNFDCMRTAEAPTIDGDALGPWLDANFTTMASADGELISHLHSSYSFDAAARFACLHDDSNMYFLVEVIDDDIVDNSLALRHDDGVVLFIDGLGDRSGTYAIDDHALMLAAEADSLDYGPGIIDPEGVRVLTDDGYRFEVEIGKDDVAIPLAPVMGFNFAIIDDDDLGNTERDVLSLWHVPDPPACPDCCPEGEAAPWCDTRVTGTLTLVDP